MLSAHNQHADYGTQYLHATGFDVSVSRAETSQFQPPLCRGVASPWGGGCHCGRGAWTAEPEGGVRAVRGLPLSLGTCWPWPVTTGDGGTGVIHTSWISRQI